MVAYVYKTTVQCTLVKKEVHFSIRLKLVVIMEITYFKCELN